MNTLVLALSVYAAVVTVGLLAVGWNLYLTRIERDAWRSECGLWAQSTGSLVARILPDKEKPL